MQGRQIIEKSYRQQKLGGASQCVVKRVSKLGRAGGQSQSSMHARQSERVGCRQCGGWLTDTNISKLQPPPPLPDLSSPLSADYSWSGVSVLSLCSALPIPIHMAPEVRFDVVEAETTFEVDQPIYGRSSLSPGPDGPQRPDIDPELMEAQSQTQLQTQLVDGPFPTSGGAENPDLYWGIIQPCAPEMSLWSLEKGKNSYTMGRNSTCDIVVNNSTVSGVHCTVMFQEAEGLVVLQDNSKNGTYVRKLYHICGSRH